MFARKSTPRGWWVSPFVGVDECIQLAMNNEHPFEIVLLHTCTSHLISITKEFTWCIFCDCCEQSWANPNYPPKWCFSIWQNWMWGNGNSSGLATTIKRPENIWNRSINLLSSSTLQLCRYATPKGLGWPQITFHSNGCSRWHYMPTNWKKVWNNQISVCRMWRSRRFCQNSKMWTQRGIRLLVKEPDLAKEFLLWCSYFSWQ